MYYKKYLKYKQKYLNKKNTINILYGGADTPTPKVMDMNLEIITKIVDKVINFFKLQQPPYQIRMDDPPTPVLQAPTPVLQAQAQVLQVPDQFRMDDMQVPESALGQRICYTNYTEDEKNDQVNAHDLLKELQNIGFCGLSCLLPRGATKQTTEQNGGGEEVCNSFSCQDQLNDIINNENFQNIYSGLLRLLISPITTDHCCLISKSSGSQPRRDDDDNPCLTLLCIPICFLLSICGSFTMSLLSLILLIILFIIIIALLPLFKIIKLCKRIENDSAESPIPFPNAKAEENTVYFYVESDDKSNQYIVTSTTIYIRMRDTDAYTPIELTDPNNKIFRILQSFLLIILQHGPKEDLSNIDEILKLIIKNHSQDLSTIIGHSTQDLRASGAVLESPPPPGAQPDEQEGSVRLKLNGIEEIIFEMHDCPICLDGNMLGSSDTCPDSRCSKKYHICFHCANHVEMETCPMCRRPKILDEIPAPTLKLIGQIEWIIKLFYAPPRTTTSQLATIQSQTPETLYGLTSRLLRDFIDPNSMRVQDSDGYSY